MTGKFSARTSGIVTPSRGQVCQNCFSTNRQKMSPCYGQPSKLDWPSQVLKTTGRSSFSRKTSVIFYSSITML
uniref:8 kDa protein n=1 Tax=Potato aucuba mosaic virus TaxID=12182 RepID=A0A385NHJ6_PAMV|nr:8 kDa protein [Potato aucuba mosaic virus]AYA73315.1 8 kDa protein [Potato aucuba mosaic virus]